MNGMTGHYEHDSGWHDMTMYGMSTYSAINDKDSWTCDIVGTHTHTDIDR
jgi:hypothetical protein